MKFFKEPESESVIKQNMSEKYGVTFELFSKVDVNGEEACGLYKYLQRTLADPEHKYTAFSKSNLICLFSILKTFLIFLGK